MDANSNGSPQVVVQQNPDVLEHFRLRLADLRKGPKQKARHGGKKLGKVYPRENMLNSAISQALEQCHHQNIAEMKRLGDFDRVTEFIVKRFVCS
jgi:hypothetical protein